MLNLLNNKKAQIKRPFFDPSPLIIRDPFLGVHQYIHNLRRAFRALQAVFYGHNLRSRLGALQGVFYG